MSRVVLAIMLVAGSSVAYAGPASAAPAWSVVPSANPPGQPGGALSGVACPSPTTCFAVGSFASGLAGGALIEQWDGTNWSPLVLPTPDPGTGANAGASLSDVACSSATNCFAVGTTGYGTQYKTLIERWDGTTWSVDPSPSSPLLSGLDSVACSSATHCFAATITTTDLVEWNGSTWSTVATASGPQQAGFFAVTCATATTCVATGEASSNGQPALLLEHWNGSTWSIVASPVPAGAFSPALDAVSCPTATSCFAVGNYQPGSSAASKTLIEQWNGTTWTIDASPTIAGVVASGLTDVSCSSANDCFAVGYAGHGPSGRPLLDLAEHWNGVTWSIVTMPSPDPKVNVLNGVTCASSTSCLAVGSSGSVSASALVERWDGTNWSTETVPQPAPSNGTLASVACASATTCFAVGQYKNAAGRIVPLIEQSGAAGWSVVPSPERPNSSFSTLSGVSCPSVNACFAVGTSDGGTAPYVRTLVERWNGKTWSIVPSPTNARFGGSFTSVSCTSAKSCFAVGQVQAFTIETLTERWNGSKWSIVPSPSRHPSPQFETAGVNNLMGVSCASAVSCFAVGDDTGYLGGFNETLVLHWNGSKWAIVKSPGGPGTKYNHLTSVSCPSANSCYAVGDSSATGTFNGTQHSLVEHWNGKAWTRVTSVDPVAARQTTLSGISCPSSTKCVAVGASSGTSERNATVVETLTGTSWSITPSPNPAGAIDASLHAVSCASPTSCLAVGDFDQFSAPQTLVESYS